MRLNEAWLVSPPLEESIAVRPQEERSFEDRREIDLGDAEAVHFWCERLEATPEELAEGVEKVGSHSDRR